MKYFLIFMILIGFTGISVISTNPAFTMCAFDPENPFAPCEDTIGTLDYPKSTDEIIPAPLKQMKLGIKLGHIICDPDKHPVWNIHYKPACVYEDSEGELLKRGWAKLRLMLPAGPDPVIELEVMGHNVYSLQILGNYQVGDEKYPLIEPRKRELAWEYSQQYHPGESYLEYAITPLQNFYNTEDKIQFDLLEWGNYSDCWDLKVRILDVQNNPTYEDNSVRYCYEPDELLGTFHSFSMGDDFEEFVCNRPGYYRIEVSNGEIFPADILENFVCLNQKPNPEPSEDVFTEPMKNAVFDKGLGHYDYLPINDNPNMMAMEKIELQDDDSIKVEFGKNNYEWSTGYKPIPEFEYNANFKVNDTFVVLCTNIGKDGYADFHPDLSEPYLPGLGIVKYLGPITIENEPILLFWHESASIQVDMPCSYPEIIHHSINLWKLQEHGLPTDNLVNAIGSNYQN